MMQAKINLCMAACIRHKLLSKRHSPGDWGGGGVVMFALCSRPANAQVSFDQVRLRLNLACQPGGYKRFLWHTTLSGLILGLSCVMQHMLHQCHDALNFLYACIAAILLTQVKCIFAVQQWLAHTACICLNTAQFQN